MGVDFVAASSQALNGGVILDTSPDLTVAGWFRPDQVAGRGVMASKWRIKPLPVTVAQRQWQFEHNGANLRAFVSTNGAFQAGNVVNGSTSLSANVWYHGGFVQYGSNTDMVLYLNGVQDGINSSGPSTVYTGGTVSFLLGAETDLDQTNVVGNEFDGLLGEWGFWNRALSAAEVLQVYRCGGQSVADGLAAYWRLLDIDSLHDEIGSLDLSVIGSPTTGEHPPITFCDASRRRRMKMIGAI